MTWIFRTTIVFLTEYGLFKVVEGEPLETPFAPGVIGGNVTCNYQFHMF